MKRIATLLLAAAFVFGSIAGASAAEFKTTGQFDFAFEWTDNTNFLDTDNDGDSEDDFSAQQRVRIQTVITASENVSGTLFFEIGNINWGNEAQGGDLGTDGINIETRRAYIDFAVPNTALQIRMGLQGLALPSAVGGNPVMDDDVAAIVGSYAFNDMFALTGFWARPTDSAVDARYDKDDKDLQLGQANYADEFDMAGLILDVNGDGYSLDPYFVYAWQGKDTQAAFTDDATTWWAGAAFEMTMFDPIVFAIDAIYGDRDAGDDEDSDQTGWFLAGKLNYKMDMFTPGIWAWYGSGDDDDQKDGSERLPVVSPSGFAPTSFGFDGAAGLLSGAIASNSGAGTWGVALVADDIKFIEDVTHTIRLAYYEGTNDEKSGGFAKGDAFKMSEDDHAWEVNIDTNYQIYENLAAAVELGWVKMDLDEIVKGDKRDETEDAWKAGVNLTYSF